MSWSGGLRRHSDAVKQADYTDAGDFQRQGGEKILRKIGEIHTGTATACIEEEWQPGDV